MTSTRIPSRPHNRLPPLPRPSLPMAPAFGLLAIGAAAAAAAAAGDLKLLALIPFAALGAVACVRWPAATVISVFAITGFANTISAYLRVPPTGTADLLLAGLWLGVAYSYLRHERERPLWLWPGLLAPGLFVVLTFASIFGAESTSAALESFRLAGWHMAALFLVALAPWSRDHLARITRGFVVVALAVGLYAIFRKITGPSAAELVFHRGSLLRPIPGETFFFGSFFTSQDLAGWSALLTPFCFALSLAWRGRWRLVAGLAAGTCAFALLAADKRSAAVGAAFGLAIVVVLYVLARRPFGAQRLAVAFLAIGAAGAIGAGAFALTIAQSERTQARFESLSDLDDDYTYQVRLSRWENAAELASERPFGHGLGTVGSIADERTDRTPIAPLLDSSYLKIAVEQGYPMLALFVAALLWLAGALAGRAVHSADPWRAAVAIGACGTLAVMLFLFYTSSFVERLTLLSGWLIVGLAAAYFTSDRGAGSEEAGESTE